MANEAKQFTIGGVTHDVMDVGARQLIAQLQAAIDAITSGDTTTAIKTFQEVIDFLDGVTDDATLIGKLNELRTLINAKYSKPTSGIPASDLADGVIPDVSGFATKTEVNAKANDNAVVKSISVNGTAQAKDGNGNVNVSVPTLTLDDVPTAGSNNPVKSGGIKTALDNLLANLRIVNNEWYIGNTATGVSAQGPAGNVNITDASQLVTILVNDLTTGGAGNILSAEMGKILRVAVQTLLDSLGEYCFPNGRPTLAWEGPKCNVTQNLTDVTSNFAPSRVDKNGSLDITLTPVDNLHVFLTGDVTVEMGGTDITSTAWNESTGKVTIADVTDDVVITAKSSTYVQSGLDFQLDGLNRGSTAGHWVDRIGNIDFALNNCAENADNVSFNGTDSVGQAGANVGINIDPSVATIECGYELIEGFSGTAAKWIPFLKNSIGDKVGLCLHNPNNNNNIYCGGESPSSNPLMLSPIIGSKASSDYMKGYVSIKMKVLASSAVLTPEEGGYFNGNRVQQSISGTGLGIGTTPMYLGSTTTGSAHLNGKIYYIRIYSRKLSDAEILHNYAIDQKRFNII